MATTPQLTVRCEARIARPVDLVRASFHDLDHAIRDRVLDGATLRWLPPRAAGERRFRQELAVMGIPQVDEVLAEEGAGGALVLRYVHGPSEGMTVTYDFTPEGDDATRVTATATVPATGFRWAIGPVYRVAVRKALEKALADRRRDLEERDYEPGHARGQIDAVLSLLGEVAERARTLPDDARRLDLVAPLLEAACVTASADGEVDDAERDVIHATARALGLSTLAGPAVDALIASSAEHARLETLEKACDELGARLRAKRLAEPGLTTAVLVAQVSRGVDQSELAVLLRLARAAGLGDDWLAERVQAVDALL